MGYIPYTASKDYFEEPNTGGDLVLEFTVDSGAILVTAMAETDLVILGLVPPSSRIGVAYGKVFDIVKISVSPGRYTGNTIQLFTNPNSGFSSILADAVYLSMQKAFSSASLSGLLPSVFAGKVLRVDYIPMSDGTSAAIITLLLYV